MKKNEPFLLNSLMQSFYLVCVFYIVNAQNKEFSKIFRKGSYPTMGRRRD
jgi:hypothetical protein